jgi:hypothetical protein
MVATILGALSRQKLLRNLSPAWGVPAGGEGGGTVGAGETNSEVP